MLVDEALAHWPRYAVAFVLMGIAAAGMALSAYLLGTMTNEAYVNHNFHGIVVIGIIAWRCFAIKGVAHLRRGTVMLSSSATASSPTTSGACSTSCCGENMSFFADRHSSEFIARLTTGAKAVSQVINLLITAIGRDLMSLIGLCRW